MAELGFTTYVTPEVTEPTLQELINGLVAGQKGAILDAFVNRVRPIDFRPWMHENYPAVDNAIPRRALVRLYQAIDSIEEAARTEMRGERLITPAVVDEEGNVTTPAVYNTPPTDAAGLLAAIQTGFVGVFTSGQVSAVLTKMVECSSKDANGNFNGTWSVYSTEVVK